MKPAIGNFDTFVSRHNAPWAENRDRLPYRNGKLSFKIVKIHTATLQTNWHTCPFRKLYKIIIERSKQFTT